MPTTPLASAENILIVKPSALGDVVQTVCIAADLARALPRAKLGWLVNSELAPLTAPLPFVARVHKFERGAMRGLLGALRGRKALNTLVSELRAQNYDVALDLQGLFRSAWIARASKARECIGFANARELAHLLYTQKIQLPGQRVHAIDRYRAFIGALGVTPTEPPQTSLATTPVEIEATRIALVGAGFPKGERPVVLCPGARWASKQWPAEYWASLADELARATSVPCVLTGSPGERELCSRVVSLATGTKPLNLAGATGLRELAALMTLARLVVTNDSGPMHLAAAQGAPLLALFGPTDPALTGPWRRPECVLRAREGEVEHKLYRRIPDDRIMREISIERVARAALEKLRSS